MISRWRSVIDMGELFNSKSVAVRFVVVIFALVQVFLKIFHFFPIISVLFHHFSPLTWVDLPLVLHKGRRGKHEDTYIHTYIYLYKQTQILYTNLCIQNYCLSLQIFIPLSIKQLSLLCPIWPTLLPQIVAYALPVLFAVFPRLM